MEINRKQFAFGAAFAAVTVGSLSVIGAVIAGVSGVAVALAVGGGAAALSGALRTGDNVDIGGKDTGNRLKDFYRGKVAMGAALLLSGLAVLGLTSGPEQEPVEEESRESILVIPLDAPDITSSLDGLSLTSDFGQANTEAPLGIVNQLISSTPSILLQPA